MEKPTSKIYIYILLFILISAGVFHIATIRDGHNWGDDFAHYIQHAKNIIEGKPYHEFSYIYNPNTPIGPKAYPPVFPLLLAPVYGLFGVNLAAFKITLILLFLCFLTVFYFFIKERLSPLYSLALIALLSFNPTFWEYKDIIISEIPFLLFLYSTLILFYKASTFSQTKKKRLRLYYLSGFFLMLTCGTRAVGVILVLVIIIYSLIKLKNWKKVVIFVCLVIISTIIFRVLFPEIFTSVLTYSHIYDFNPKSNFKNIYGYSYALGSFWNHNNPHIINRILSAILLFIALIGFLLQIRKEITIFEVFISIYFFSLVLLPWTVDRFLIPVFPLLVYYTFLALSQVNRVLSLRKQNIIFTLVLLFIVQLYFQRYIIADFGPIDNGVGKQTTIELFAFIKAKTTYDDVIVFQKPRVMAFFTERKVLICHFAKTYNDLWNYFNENNVSYIVVAKVFEDYNYINEFQQEYEKFLELKFVNNDFRVYKVKNYD